MKKIPAIALLASSLSFGVSAHTYEETQEAYSRANALDLEAKCLVAALDSLARYEETPLKELPEYDSLVLMLKDKYAAHKIQNTWVIRDLTEDEYVEKYVADHLLDLHTAYKRLKADAIVSPSFYDSNFMSVCDGLRYIKKYGL